MIDDTKIFMIFAIESKGELSPEEMAKVAVEENSVFRLPITAADEVTAVELYAKEYPQHLVTGLISLATLKETCAELEAYRDGILGKQA